MRFPLNIQVIVGHFNSINVRPYYSEPRWVTWISMGQLCTENCGYAEEHYTFDGQIFYQVEEK